MKNKSLVFTFCAINIVTQLCYPKYTVCLGLVFLTNISDHISAFCAAACHNRAFLYSRALEYCQTCAMSGTEFHPSDEKFLRTAKQLEACQSDDDRARVYRSVVSQDFSDQSLNSKSTQASPGPAGRECCQ